MSDVINTGILTGILTAYNCGIIQLRSASLINGSDEQWTRCCHIIARRESFSWNNYNELEACPL